MVFIGEKLGNLVLTIKLTAIFLFPCNPIYSVSQKKSPPPAWTSHFFHFFTYG